MTRSACGSYVRTKKTSPTGDKNPCYGVKNKKSCDQSFCSWDKKAKTCTRHAETCGYGVKKVTINGPMLYTGKGKVMSACDCESRCNKAGGKFWAYSSNKQKCQCSNSGIKKVLLGNKVKWYSSHREKQ
eukprot:TRINITY_DN306_c0_g1_i1.p1 TRINITY_DN306_c0_g1~~TRINITY_DN306_c0_g1_i1.p1  ORF type:complete len:129 (-),score=28.01 TRINITY_DN306_c0_g1_i1:32-418(-)